MLYIYRWFEIRFSNGKTQKLGMGLCKFKAFCNLCDEGTTNEFSCPGGTTGSTSSTNTQTESTSLNVNDKYQH